jgi:beta-galactosidase
LKNVLWEIEANPKTYSASTLFRAELVINDTPNDNYIMLNDKWIKGVIFVNAFNIGRFSNISPQKSYYIPLYLLKTGKNDIHIFDLHNSPNYFSNATIEFIDKKFLV